MLTSQAREILARRRGGDRRRDPRRRRDEARRAPRADARAPRRTRTTDRDLAAHRPVARRRTRSRRSAASWSARGGRAGRRRRRAQAARPEDPRAGRVDGRAGRSPPTASDPLDPLDAWRRRGDPRARSGRRSTRELLELVSEHRSTIIFVNNRRGAERLALRLERAGADEERTSRRDRARPPRLARARGARSSSRSMLKAGELPCLVATSSLELGIDMGAVDLVLQVESPKSVAAACSASAAPATTSATSRKGRIFPKFRADLLECAVVVKLMREGRIEPTVVPRNPLDVLAQQIVAIAASAEPDDGRASTTLYALVTAHPLLRRAAARAARERPRHARRPLPVAGVRRAAPAHRVGPRRRHDPRAQGRAPARGHQRRHDPRPRPVRRHAARRPPRRRARRGDGLRGARPARRSCSARRRGASRRSAATASSSRPRRACPARCRSGRATASAGRRSSARRSARSPLGGRPGRRGRSRRDYDLDPLAAAQPRSTSCASSRRPRASCRATARSSSSASATRSATGACACSARTAAASTPPGALALSARIRDEFGLESDAIWSDDGIIVHLPDADEPPGADLVLLEPDEIEDARRRRARPRARCSARASARTPAARC